MNLGMKIACLGWGSLIWDQQNLKVQHEWLKNGPQLPIEFTRHSSDDRITLIIDKEAKPITVLWALMESEKLDEALNSLIIREKVIRKDDIHSVRVSDITDDSIKLNIIEWLKLNKIDAAIWTGLSYSKKTNNIRPTLSYIINHLSTIKDEEKKHEAEKYIRKAPEQIDTEFRRAIIKKLGWCSQIKS